MAEERTGSTLDWLQPSRKGKLGTKLLLDMVRIYHMLKFQERQRENKPAKVRSSLARSLVIVQHKAHLNSAWTKPVKMDDDDYAAALDKPVATGLSVDAAVTVALLEADDLETVYPAYHEEKDDDIGVTDVATRLESDDSTYTWAIERYVNLDDPAFERVFGDPSKRSVDVDEEEERSRKRSRTEPAEPVSLFNAYSNGASLL